MGLSYCSLMGAAPAQPPTSNCFENNDFMTPDIMASNNCFIN